MQDEVILPVVRAAVLADEINYTEHVLGYKGDDTRPKLEEAEIGLVGAEVAVIERYGPRDTGHKRSCLVRGVVHGRVIHVVVSYPMDDDPYEVDFISFYWPDTQPDEWDAEYRVRRTGQ